MNAKHIILLLSSVFLTTVLFASQNKIDSLVNLARIEKNDSVLISLYNEIAETSNKQDEQISEEYWSKALVLGKKKLKEQHSVYFMEQLANANTGMGIISTRIGNLSGAILYYQEGVKINQTIDDLNGLGSNYFNIGVIYRSLKDYEKSLDYYQKSLKLRKAVKDTVGIISSYLAIGVIYRRTDDYDRALEYYNKSLVLAEKINDKKHTAYTHNNIGVIHNLNKNYAEAITYLNLAFEYIKTQKRQASIAKLHSNMAAAYSGQGNVSRALIESEIAYRMYVKMNRISDISSEANTLSELYAKNSNYSKAYDYYREHIVFRDSLCNEKNTKEFTERDMQYEFDKKNLSDSLARFETEKINQLEHQQEIENRNIFMYAGSLILFLVIIFSILLFNRLRISNKQKAIIKNQKMIVDFKNKEITDSINYAKRIQSAILPSLEKIKESFSNSFIFYKPKDIVAGDFYWYKKVNNKVFIAVGDCTGHGVPGAMVSVICENALNRAVNDLKLLDPSKILDKTAELIIEIFKEDNDEGMRDGMDISLCCFDLENKKLEYAGAMNSLFYLSNNKLEEIKGDKQPIGYYVKTKPFTLHKVNLEKGDRVYIFSDGYADQFGGPKDKKYMHKRFRDLILKGSTLNFLNQKKELEKEFDTWKRNSEQVDDVCVIGIEV